MNREEQDFIMKYLKKKYTLLLVVVLLFMIVECAMFWMYLDEEQYFWAAFYGIAIIVLGFVVGKIVNNLKELKDGFSE